MDFRIRSLALCLLASLISNGVCGAGGEPPFAVCEAQLTGGAERSEAFRCFYREALQQNLLDDGADRLRELRARHPGDPWLLLNLGNVVLLQGGAQAEALYRAAASGFGERGERRWAARARVNLSNFLRRSGRLREAERELAEAGRIAAALDDAPLLAEIRVHQANHLLGEGIELDRAYRQLKEVENELFPQGPEWLQLTCLQTLGAVSYELGRHSEALVYHQRRAKLLAARGDLYREASARFNVAATYLDLWPRETSREEVVAQVGEALAAARTAGHRSVEARASLVLGKLLGGQRGREHLEHCLAVARELQSPPEIGECLSALAVEYLESDPAKAVLLNDEALALAVDAEASWSMLHGWSDRLRVRWATRPREEAIAESLATLDAIENLRELQADDSGRAGLFSIWAEAFYWLSGRLLAAPGGPSRKDLELAFAIGERMRARVLLETLHAGRALEPAAAQSGELAAALEQIAGIQRRLLDPRLSGEDRSELLDALDRLERREAGLRAELARSAPRRPVAGAMAGLPQVEASLADNEALFTFQVALSRNIFRVAAGSWLLVSTRRGTAVYRLPGREDLEPAVAVFLGLFDRGQGPEAAPAAAVRLYGDLVQQAIEDLPPEVDRLVMVPDGILHRLPFGALRAVADEPPLAVRYRLSRAPSATLWQRWRSRPPAGAAEALLVLADPVWAGDEAAQAGARGSAFAGGARLGALPHARREGRAALRHLGRDGRLAVGAAASERFLKLQEPRRFRVLHLAAHAVIDDRHPQRSAVVLARGGGGEDGLLQPREIVELDFEDQVIVLSACDSAVGQVLRGEGVMSLARAFFQAGARTVVASLWRLQDEDAKLFFDRFYRHLGSGSSVAAALQGAQRDRIRDGAPAAAWAGLVALGDGELVVVPAGVSRPLLAGWRSVLLFALAMALLAAVALAAWSRGRRAPPLDEVPDRKAGKSAR